MAPIYVLHQSITLTSGDLLSIGPIGTNFSEIWTKYAMLFIHENDLQVAK